MLLAYDTTSKESLEKVNMWLQEVKQFTDEATIAIAIGMQSGVPHT